MEEVFRNPVQFSKGINLHDLMNSDAEFHLDMDFSSKKDGIDLSEYGDMIPDAEDDEDSDSEDVFGQVEKRTEEMMLSSPEYMSFEELASKMIDLPCRPAGAVKISIIEEGDGALIPANSDVSIHYAAYWEKGSVPFDSSLSINDGKPIHIRLGSGRFIPGLEIALANVKGPTARILALLQPEVAWGKHGVPPRIRPEPALLVVAVYSVKEALAQDTFNSLSTEEQGNYATTVRTVQSLRATAKQHFQKQRYGRAISTYQQAMYVLSLSRPETERDSRELSNLKIKQFVNLAVCYYKLNKPHRVINMCDNIDKIIYLDSHCKGLFYKGRAYEMLGKLEEALDLYKRALKLEPNNKEIGMLLAELDAKIRKSKKDEMNMWQRAFNAKPIKKETFKVDEEFEKNVKELCGDLASRTEYTKVELPIGLVTDELACLKLEASRAQLIVEEDGDGRKKRVSVIKRI